MVYVQCALSCVYPNVSSERKTSHKKKRYIDTFSLVCHSDPCPEEMLAEEGTDGDVAVVAVVAAVVVVADGGDEETFELPLAIPYLSPKFLPVLPSSKYPHLFSLQLRQCSAWDLTCF